MTDFSTMGAAVIGTGFIGSVHIGALRRLGVRIEGVLGSSAERGAAGAKAMSVGKAYATLGELLADPKVDLVHVTSPNHAHYAQVKAILAAGKHVICEKPLSMTSAESAEMVELARASGKVAAVCYNIRFYPLNQHAHGMVKAGELGDIRFVTGHYHQDWLAKPSDWNWRLESEQGGALRSVGDIGTHWVDLVSFITGQKVAAVFADLTTFIKERQKPVGPVATFAAASGKTETRRIETDDAAMIMLRFANGAKGVMTTSQINIGRKNALHWDVAGATASAAWDSEMPDHLFIGHRDAPNQIMQRDPAMMNAAGAAAAALPGGHVEGFADSFRALFQQVYTDAAKGVRAKTSTYASFEDGHHEMRFCDAVLRSAAEGRWVDV
ncbi:MAG: Gfo/Idh/MocA family oxidoreductase [Paracoccaceae bacterium]